MEAKNHNTIITPNFPETIISEIHRIKKFYFFLVAIIQILRSLAYALGLVLIWSLILPENPIASAEVGLVVFIVSLFLCEWQIRMPRISPLLLSLDMKNHTTKTSIYDRKQWKEDSFREQWKAPAQEILSEIRSLERNRLLLQTSSLFLPAVLACFLMAFTNASPLSGFFELKRIFSPKRVYLNVIQGGIGNFPSKPISISPSNPLKIEVAQSNLIEIIYSNKSDKKAPPTIELRAQENQETIYQTFQMSLQQVENRSFYGIQFSIPSNSLLFVPDFIKDKPLAIITVEKLPVPEVTLKPEQPIQQPWPDDKPINVIIDVSSKKPLQNLNLIIKVGSHNFKESIFNIASEEKYKIHVKQSISLSKYLDEDTALVEIRAEAIDRSIPKPMIGYSQALSFETISSYGRYRKTLTSLKKIKEKLDSSVSSSKPNIDKETAPLMEEIAHAADQSPFFDALDRLQISNINKMIKQNIEQADLAKVLQISKVVSEFLEDHEMLDDRERDRDFFVAARGLSRLLEEKEGNPSLNGIAIDKILSFLADREKRWQARINRLVNAEKLTLKNDAIGKKTFSKSLNEIKKSSANPKETKYDSLHLLSQTVSLYRQWIEQLEAQEDLEREQKEKDRKKGIASAKEELQELQKRQLEISTRLHHADTRPKDEMAQDWPVTRMHENTNIEDTKKLEEKLNALAPRSAERLRLAMESMKVTAESGDESNFVKAESLSDLAGRLLHQTSKMTEQEEQQKGKRERRSSGNNYYGQSIVGGDVETEHEYQVDPHYREEVLDEVLKSEYEGDNKAILNNFLKRIIR